MLNRNNSIVTILCITILSIFGCSGDRAADLVVQNGNIYSVDVNSQKASAVAVKGGRIIAVGSNPDIDPFVGKKTRVVDLEGLTMIPGFIESHGHIMGLGSSKMKLDLNGIKDYDELVDIVANAVSETVPGEWILGRGWHQSKWTPQPETMVKGFQTHHKLSAVSPDNPVYLTHASGHAGFANAKAMEIAGILSGTIFDMELGDEIVKGINDVKYKG